MSQDIFDNLEHEPISDDNYRCRYCLGMVEDGEYPSQCSGECDFGCEDAIYEDDPSDLSFS